MARADLRWVKGKLRRFLNTLAATYDTAAACTVSGLTWPQICRCRTLHPWFADAYQEVIAAGYDRLEAMMLREAGVAAGEGGVDVVKNAALGHTLLKQRRAGTAADGANRSGARGAKRLSRDELIRKIRERNAALSARAADGAGEDARGRGLYESEKRDLAGGGALSRPADPCGRGSPGG